MVTSVVMPRYSLTMEDGIIVKWLRKEGDHVEKGEPIVEVITEKVNAEIGAPVSGTILKIVALEETEVPVGEPIAFIGEPGESIPRVETSKKRDIAPAIEAPAPKGGLTMGEGRVRVRASPLARKLARDHQIDLTRIAGTGPKDRITKRDVLRFIELSKEKRAVKEIVPMKRMMKVIAERMSRSVKTAAHCSMTIEVDASQLRRLRLYEAAEAEAEGRPKLSYTAIIVKAAATALKEHPMVNSTLEDDRIKIFEDINIGIAVEVGDEREPGLIVPVIHKANEKSVLEIDEEARNLVERARAGKASNDDTSGGTFTITNLGAYGIDAFVPIINPPETAILGVGAIVDKPVVVEGKIEVQPIMKLTLSFDHRVLNGAPAARFLQRLRQILEKEI